MNELGFFKVNRCLFEHPIWLTSSPEHKVVLIALIGMANHKDNKWVWEGEEFTVRRGQMITSLTSIKKHCGTGVSEQNVRGALKRFEEKFHFLTNKSTKTGRLITIENYSKWQDDTQESDKVTNKEVTKSQQRGNKEVTPNKNDKNDKNERRERGQAPVARSVLQNYVQEKNLNVDVDVFWSYYEENDWVKKNGSPVTDWKKTLATWAAREQKQVKKKTKPKPEPPRKEKKPEKIDAVPMPEEIRKKFNRAFKSV